MGRRPRYRPDLRRFGTARDFASRARVDAPDGTVERVTAPRNEVLVVGAGVIGLTTAITFAEAGVPTTIWTADEVTAITSYAAGASWGVHLLSPRGRVAAGSAATLDVLRTLATDPTTGVRITAGIEASRTPIAPPDWGAPVDGMRECTPEELPPGYAIGWHQRIPIVEMPVYLGYLRGRFEAAGGVIERRRIAALAETAGIAPVVVNCTGVGASDLTGDRDLVPIRGQVVIVANPGITEFFADGPDDSTDLTYWFPHRDTVLLGGTAVIGDWNRVQDPAVAAAIVARCAAVEPRFATAEVVEHRVGLRPGRPEPRLEQQTLDDGTRLIHNYGHGGSGVTLAWGCAAEVATLAGLAGRLH
jgi:D-amino-acid oxidase